MDDQEFLQMRKAAEKLQEQLLVDAVKSGTYGRRSMAKAAQQASNFAKGDGLHPVTDIESRELRYSIKQGLRAACVSREDAAATLILMPTVLDNQMAIKRLLYVVIALLAYITHKI